MDGSQVISGFSKRLVQTTLMLVALGLTSCAMDAQQSSFDGVNSQPAPREQPLQKGDYILVNSNARFFEVIDDLERSYRAFSWSQERASRPFEPTIIAEVIADHGDMIEIRRTPPSEDLICDNRGLTRNANVELRFFVLREDLALTLQRPISYRYEDETGFDLQPGLVLVPDESQSDRYHTWHGQFVFTVDLPRDFVGIGFSDFARFEVDTDPDRIVQGEADARIGESPLLVKEPRRRRVYGATMLETHGDKTIAQIQMECAHLTVAVPTEDISAGSVGYGFGMAGSGASCGCFRDHLLFTEGTPVYWTDGEEAGVLTESFRYYQEPEEPQESMICRTTVLLSSSLRDINDDDQRIEYCVSRGDARFIRSPLSTPPSPSLSIGTVTVEPIPTR